jgi:hypothetical protein
MINFFYRKSMIDFAEQASQKCPALRLTDDHPSLVLLRRENLPAERGSRLLFKNWEEARALILEVTGGASYNICAVDLFGDEYSFDEMREIIEKSDYAMAEPDSVSGKDFYRTAGTFKNSSLYELAKKFHEEDAAAEEKARIEKAGAEIAEAIGMQPEIGVRLVKAGFNSVHVFQGVTTDDLTVGGAFGLEEAEVILDRLKTKGLL